jgi:alpha-tubulin suppressor-like RCC1 family protein
LTSSGLLYAWGWNAYGQAGAGLKQHNIDVPVAVKLPNGITVTAIGTGSNHDLAVTSAGGLLTWGLNADGQLGNGSFTNSSVPVSIALPNGDAAVAACGGYDHSLVLGASGSVYAWGLNNHGQLGDGTEVQSSVPVTVQMPPGIMVAAVAAGEDYSLAMDTNGNVYAWGFGGDDDLGNGSQLDSTTPVSVDVPPGVVPVAIAAGGNRAHLLSAAGQIYDWGSGENGKHTDPVPTLDKVPPGETPVAIGDGPEAEQYLAEMVP